MAGDLTREALALLSGGLVRESVPQGVVTRKRRLPYGPDDHGERPISLTLELTDAESLRICSCGLEGGCVVPDPGTRGVIGRRPLSSAGVRELVRPATGPTRPATGRLRRLSLVATTPIAETSGFTSCDRDAGGFDGEGISFINYKSPVAGTNRHPRRER